MIRTLLLSGVASFAIVACGAEPAVPQETTQQPVETTEAIEKATPTAGFADIEAVAGEYELEVTHAYLAAYVGHGNGLSRYQINFTDLSASLNFDPANVEAASLSFTVNAMGVETNYSGDYKAGHAESGFETWNEDISRDKKWLNADEHPTASFVSTGASRTGDNTGTLTGDLTLLGQTHSVTFDVTYNGSGTSRRSKKPLLGFDATTTINRSEWGMGAFAPVISDDVRLDFSGEFIGLESVE